MMQMHFGLHFKVLIKQIPQESIPVGCGGRHYMSLARDEHPPPGHTLPDIPIHLVTLCKMFPVLRILKLQIIPSGNLRTNAIFKTSIRFNSKVCKDNYSHD